MKGWMLAAVLILAGTLCWAQDGSVLLQDGMKAYQQGDYETAITRLKKASETLTNIEDKASAYLALGIIYQLLNDEENARTQFANAVIVNPDLKLDRDFYSTKTIQLFDQAKHEGLSRVKKGKALYLEGKYEEALKQIDTGINLLQATSPKIERHIIIDGYLTAATIYQLMARNESAVAEFQKALRVNSELNLDPELYSSSTIELFQQARGKGDQAVAQARRMIAQNDFKGAIQAIEKNRDLYYTRNTQKEANFVLAEAYFSASQQELASSAVAAVLNLDPEFKPQQNSTEAFNDFFQKERRKLTGTLPKVLIVRGSGNPVHALAIDGFRKQMSAAELQETPAEGVDSAMKKYSPQAVFVTGANSLQSVKKVQASVPVVFTNVLKSEAGDLRNTNIGGIVWEVPVEAQFSFIAAVLPRSRRIGVVYNKDYSQHIIQEASKMAPKYGLEIVERTATDPDEMLDAVDEMKNIDLLWVIPDKSLVNTPDIFKNVLNWAYSRNLPVLAYHEAFVKEGALFSVSSDFSSMGGQAAELLQNLLDHKTTADLPVIPPSLSKLAINLSAAKKLKLEVNPNVVSSAAIVYK
jgi:ABC-type uncharacterized transport system substrate-binding protein/tetratricopeptide (TPR) repeat protein